jgi:hypothetical protein
MPVQLPSFGSDVPDTIKRSLQALAAAVNQLEPRLQTQPMTAHVDDVQAIRAQLIEAISRIDDLTRRVRALGG